MRLMVREIRRKMGMTQEQFAKHVGFPQQTISNIEIGARVPKITTMVTLAKALDCKVDDLIDDSEKA